MTDEDKLVSLGPNDPFTQAIKDWDATPKAEREAFYREHAVAIDRWQAETDAMAEEEGSTEK